MRIRRRPCRVRPHCVHLNRNVVRRATPGHRDTVADAIIAVAAAPRRLLLHVVGLGTPQLLPRARLTIGHGVAAIGVARVARPRVACCRRPARLLVGAGVAGHAELLNPASVVFDRTVAPHETRASESRRGLTASRPWLRLSDPCCCDPDFLPSAGTNASKKKPQYCKSCAQDRRCAKDLGSRMTTPLNGVLAARISLPSPLPCRLQS